MFNETMRPATSSPLSAYNLPIIQLPYMVNF